MKTPGDSELGVRTRAALLDALQALEPQRDALIVIGAQAVYLHTGEIDVAIPEETKDADLGIDIGALQEEPLIEQAIAAANFSKDLENSQPGTWISPDGIPVDLMVPEAMAGPSAPNRRGARVPPHDKAAMRRAEGLEAVVVENSEVVVGSLDPENDKRSYLVKVAGPAALLVAKLHKIGERQAEGGGRLGNKDGHDVYRLLVAIETAELATAISRLLDDPFSRAVTEQALNYLAELFAAGVDATGSALAASAVEGVGEPETVAASVSELSRDLLRAVDERRSA